MGRALLSLSAVILLFISSTLAGCLSLVPAREMMESLRDKPLIEMTEDKVNISHVFDSLDISQTLSPYTADRIMPVPMKCRFTSAPLCPPVVSPATSPIQSDMSMPDCSDQMVVYIGKLM